MNKVQIIGVPQSTCVRTVRIVAEEMGIPYLLEPERPHTPAVSTIHPLGKIPVMRHGDITVPVGPSSTRTLSESGPVSPS